MARDGSGIYSAPAGTTATAGTTIESAKYNAFVNDLVTDANTARPIVAGGTGATTAGAALAALGGQPLDAGLTSIAGLTTAADRMIYTTAADVYAVATLTAAGRALLDDADAAAQLVTLGAQAALGFTPVEQGGGTDMATNKIRIGWRTDSLGLQAQVDTTALGTLVRNVGTPAGQNSELSAPGSAPLFACRAWVNFNGTGTVAIRASGNVSSITDNGVGNYTINFTTAMPDANFALIANSGDYSSGTAYLYTQERAGTRSTSSVAVTTGFVNAGAAGVQDNANCFVAIFR